MLLCHTKQIKVQQCTREQKLEFIDLYKKRKAKAVREFKERYKFELKSSTYNPRIKQELKLSNGVFQSRKMGSGGNAAYPDMEKELYSEIQDLRSKGIKVKEWWFCNRCKQIMEKLYPDVTDFKMSNRWPTHAAQKHSENLRTSVQQFNSSTGT